MNLKISLYGVLVIGVLVNSSNAREEGGYTYHFEQDLFANKAKNEDRDYTQGVAIEFYGNRVSNSFFFNQPLNSIDNLIDKLVGLSSEDFEPGTTDSFTFGLRAYTPRDISETEPIPYDRPFASYLFMRDLKIRVLKSDGSNSQKYLQTSFTVANLGNSLAKDFQHMVHQLSDNRRIPQGWGNQIKKPLVFNYQISRLYRYKRNDYFEYGFDIGANIGTVFNDASIGASFRSGWFGTNYLNFPGLEDSNRVALSHYKRSGANEKRCNFKILDWDSNWHECYIFFASSAKFVGSNRLLHGYSGNPVRIPNDDIEDWVGTLSGGFTVRFTKHFTLTIAQHVRTNEFTSDHPMYGGDRNHYYGGIYMVFAIPME